MKCNGVNLRLNKQLVEKPALMEPMIVDIKEHGFDLSSLPNVAGVLDAVLGEMAVPKLVDGDDGLWLGRFEVDGQRVVLAGKRERAGHFDACVSVDGRCYRMSGARNRDPSSLPFSG